MTLGIGDRVAKLQRDWTQPGGPVKEPATLVEGEMYREFEVLAIGTQSEEPFYVLVKKVK